MMLFRNALDSDLDRIHQLAELSGVGMTTLPKDKELLKKRISWSTASYQKQLQEPENEYYLFVLEDVARQEIAGVSAIESKIGYETPFYSYKISKRTRICRSLNIRTNYEILSLVNDNQGRSELCTLFLNPEYRKNNNGLLLSKGRFLFMAQYPERFAPVVIADIRGVSDEKGSSPFWENVGAHFFQIPYSEADRLTLATDKQFIADLMPHQCIYKKLLSPEAQAVIAQPHPATLAAMKILQGENFYFNNYVDIFDAGPTLEAPLSEIKTIKSCVRLTITSLSDEVSGARYLLSNGMLHFRATADTALVDYEKNSCIISKETAQLLNVTAGDTVRVSPLRIG